MTIKIAAKMATAMNKDAIVCGSGEVFQ